MTYQIEITPEALAEAEEAYLWLRHHSPTHAAKWYNGLLDALRSLKSHPKRWSLAPESEAFNEEIRQLLYGKRRNIYRILYVVRGHTVHVLHVRHSARPFLEP